MALELTFTPEQQRFRAEVRAWMAAHVPAIPLKTLESEAGFAQHREWERTLARGNYGMITWPREYGGRGANLIDWEDLSIGRCGSADCLYIADIGDNRESRDRITIYRVPEPAAGSGSTLPADAFHLTYPDRPHDAEALHGS